MKRGTIREDGKVFARMLNGKEMWITKEQYEKREKSRKDYSKRCRKSYYSRRQAVRTLGEYDHNKNLYFCGISCSGKEVWRKKVFADRILNASRKNKKKYTERCKTNYPPTTLKFGDKNPLNPNEYVVLKVGNKIFFGSLKRLNEVKETKRVIYARRYFKAKKIRKNFLNNIENRKRRGDSRIEDNKLFWEYNRVGKEIWLCPEVFHFKRKVCCDRRNLCRKKHKLAMLEHKQINFQEHELALDKVKKSRKK